MNKAIEKLVNASRPEHPRFRDQRLREVLQVLVLLGLKRAGFFRMRRFMAERHFGFYMGLIVFRRILISACIPKS